MRKICEYTGGDLPRDIYNPDGPTHFLPRQGVHILNRVNDGEDDEFRIRTMNGREYIVDGCDLSPHPDERELNTEFMVRMMEYGNPLVQGFVIEAVEKYSRLVLAMSDEDRAAMDASFISYAGWQQCAQQCLGLIAARDVELRGNKELTPAG
jgi:hypothetical protein